MGPSSTAACLQRLPSWKGPNRLLLLRFVALMRLLLPGFPSRSSGRPGAVTYTTARVISHWATPEVRFAWVGYLERVTGSWATCPGVLPRLGGEQHAGEHEVDQGFQARFVRAAPVEQLEVEDGAEEHAMDEAGVGVWPQLAAPDGAL